MLPRCPIQTRILPPELQYAGADEEVRAYKLGKRRWSYNQVEVVLQEEGGLRGLRVCQAISQSSESLDPLYRDSAVVFRLELSNGTSVLLHGFLCYDVGPGSRFEGRRGAGRAGQTPAPSSDVNRALQVWHLVRREECCKSCTGPVVRVIQRFGKMGRRTTSVVIGGGGGGSPVVPARPRFRAGPPVAASPASPLREGSGGLKDPRHMYLSFDEAGTHVGAKAFRLIVALLDPTDDYRLLGSASSPPIRVLANNDVPTGAAHIKLQVLVDAAWPGWAGAGRLTSHIPASPIEQPGAVNAGLGRAADPSAHGFDRAQRFGIKVGSRPADEDAGWAGLNALGDHEPYARHLMAGHAGAAAPPPILSIGTGAWTGDAGTPKGNQVVRTSTLDSPGHGSQTSSGSGLGAGGPGGPHAPNSPHGGLPNLDPHRPRGDWAPVGREGPAWTTPGEHLGAHYPSSGVGPSLLGRGWSGPGGSADGDVHAGGGGPDETGPESARSLHLRRRLDSGSAVAASFGGAHAAAASTIDERWIWEDVLRTFRSVPGLGSDAAAAAATAAAAAAAAGGEAWRGAGALSASHAVLQGMRPVPGGNVAQQHHLQHQHLLQHDLASAGGVPLLGAGYNDELGGGPGGDTLHLGGILSAVAAAQQSEAGPAGSTAKPRVLQGFVLGEGRAGHGAGAGWAAPHLTHPHGRGGSGAMGGVARSDSGLEELAEAMLGDPGMLAGLEGLGAGDLMGGGYAGLTAGHLGGQAGSSTGQADPRLPPAPGLLHPLPRRQHHVASHAGMALHPPAMLEALQYLESLPGMTLGLGAVDPGTSGHSRGPTPPPLRMPLRGGVVAAAAVVHDPAAPGASAVSPATPGTVSPRSARVLPDDGLVFTPMHPAAGGHGAGPAMNPGLALPAGSSVAM